MSWLRLPIVLVFGVAAFVTGTVLVERTAIDRLLEYDAANDAQSWTDFIARSLDTDPAFIARGILSVDTTNFIQRVKPASRIFLFKVYDASGKLLFISDDRPLGQSDREALTKHNPEAAEAIEAGKPLVESAHGVPPERPSFYSEAYVPLRGQSGATIGVVESYIDQTEKRDQFLRAFGFSTIGLGILVALAFGLPAAGWYRWRRAQEKTSERVHFLSRHDPLLGILNRAAAVEDLDRLLAAANGPRQAAIHKIDIDRFKDINSSIGMDGGDDFLRSFADRLSRLAGEGHILARLGADEFMVVRPGSAAADSAEEFAWMLLRDLRRPFQVGDQEVSVSACIGTAIAPDHGEDAERLMRSAKLALAHAKALGPGHAQTFSTDLDAALQRRLTVERAIVKAVGRRAFDVHYQPLYDNAGRLTGFEALARLPTEKGGFIPPVEFIPAAERMGLIDQVGYFMLEAACSAAATWPENLVISVNLSPAQFHDGRVTRTIADVLERTRLAPNRLLLEITESVLLEDRDDVMMQLRELKRLGTPIVMDDFGTGYSSLSYLWRFPFDKIKIDASFMRGIAKGEKTASKVVQSITLLGQALGLKVCVEGIETEEQAETARVLGCDEMQGFYFARPAPFTDVAAIVLRDYMARAGTASAENDAEAEALARRTDRVAMG